MSKAALIKNTQRCLETTSARKLWFHLNGVLNVYKPAGVSTKSVQHMIRSHICEDLNAMDPDDTPKVMINRLSDGKYAVELVKDSAQLDLTIGPRYMPNDVKCNVANWLGRNTSGVLVLGLNKSTNIVTKLHHGASMRTYQVSGRFGKGTETNFKDSLISARATYQHIFSGKLTSLLASMQASHQRKMFEMNGVDLRSQTAYELACKGPFRSIDQTVPLLYGIRCLEFQRPHFTLEIDALHANEQYLCDLIAEIGLQLRSMAHCTKIRCTRYGFFTYETSLLRGQWQMENLIRNMKLCKEIIRKYPSMLEENVATPVGHKNTEETENPSPVDEAQTSSN